MGATTPARLTGGGDRLRILAHLAWPAIIEQILGTMVSYVDTGMVGVLGATSTAAVAINAASIWLVNGTLAGIGVGYSVQVANAIGAGDPEQARRVIRQAVHLGVPYIAERATINLGQVAMTFVVAKLGTVALAANHIATTAEGLCYLPAYGISFAATALVGQSVGAKNREDARAYGTLAGIAGFLLCSATGLALFFLARPLAGLFTTDQAVIDQAALVLRIVSVSEPFFAAFIVLSGALRGAHDVRFPMFLALFCMWGVRVVCAPILVFVLDVGLAGVWTAMAADLIFRGVLCAFRWKSGRWVAKAGLE